MKKNSLFLTIIITLFYAFSLHACPFCHTQAGIAIYAGLFNDDFLLVLTTLMTVFISFYATVVMICYVITTRMHKLIRLNDNKIELLHLPKHMGFLTAAGMLLGGVIVGFLDVIIFHQILQWHGMIANRVPLNSLINVEINMFWDGVFHLFILIMLVISQIFLWKSLMCSTKKTNHTFTLFCGFMLMGGGIFNLLEGFIDHHLFSLHHVIQQTTPQGQLVGDLIFILVAMFLLIFGVICIKNNLKYDK